jgi:hypothetical protein
MVVTIIGRKEVILVSYKNMLNYFIYYLMFGLLTNFIIDVLSNYFDSSNRLTILERVLVGLLWPWAVYKVIREYYKLK